MYSDVFEVDDKVMGMDYLTPIGKAKVMREGKNFNYLYIKKKKKFEKIIRN